MHTPIVTQKPKIAQATFRWLQMKSAINVEQNIKSLCGILNQLALNYRQQILRLQQVIAGNNSPDTKQNQDSGQHQTNNAFKQ